MAASLATALAGGATAHANGAFPDSLQILLPSDRPQQIIVSTTFGLIISDDDGQTWSWTCEQDNTNNAGLYQVGPAPMDRLFALSGDGLAFSDDQSCTWNLATGDLSQGIINDDFPDPNNAKRVLALGISQAGTAEVMASTDSGSSFTTPVFVAPTGGALTSVEIARSDPQVMYVAMFQTPGTHPRLVRTSDGGAHWDAPIDVEPTLGANIFRIIAIDPTNPERIYLRVQGGLDNTLAISEDGGKTLSTPLVFDTMTAFVRMASGTILIAGQKASATVAFRSTDAGKTFTPWPNPPGIRALAERNGKLYVSADNTKDGFALAVSTDAGQTLHPLLTFSKVSSVRACARTACADSCAAQVALKLWPAEVCQAGTSPPPPPPPPKPAAKSGCSLGGGPASLAETLALGAVLGLSVLARRRRHRGAASLKI